MATKKRAARRSGKKVATKTRRGKRTAAAPETRPSYASVPASPLPLSSLETGIAPDGGSFALRGPLADSKEKSVLEAASDDRTRKVSIKVKHEFRPAQRGIAKEETASIAPDDVIELEFADGTCTWMRADEYRERFATGPTRDAKDAQLYVPTTIPVPSTGVATRGVTSWVLKSIKVLGVDVPKTSALAIANTVENRASLKRPGFG